jgi:hypothetical protein
LTGSLGLINPTKNLGRHRQRLWHLGDERHRLGSTRLAKKGGENKEAAALKGHGGVLGALVASEDGQLAPTACEAAGGTGVARRMAARSVRPTPRRGVRPSGSCRGSTERAVHRGDAKASVHRRKAGSTQGARSSLTCATRRSDTGALAHFHPICPVLKTLNSKMYQLNCNSPKIEVVEEL